MGITLAILRACGNSPAEKEQFIISASGVATLPILKLAYIRINVVHSLTMGCANCLTHRYHFLGAGRAEPKRTQYNIICDILFVISHEARPSSVPPKLELWGGTVNTAVPPVKTLEETVPPCPPMIYATEYAIRLPKPTAAEIFLSVNHRY